MYVLLNYKTDWLLSNVEFAIGNIHFRSSGDQSSDLFKLSDLVDIVQREAAGLSSPSGKSPTGLTNKGTKK